MPPGGNPVLAQYDRPFFVITNPNAYPSTYGPVDRDTITAGFSVDYASSNPSFIVGLADWWRRGGVGLFHQRRPDLDEIRNRNSGSGLFVHRRIDRRQHAAKHHLAPSDDHQPYYTLNGGTTWNPITLPGVTCWTNNNAWYLDQRSVTADRVLANTFYLYEPGQGVFSTSNGGQSWSKVYSGSIGPDDGWNSTLMSVPGEASNLFYTGGQ